MKAILEAQQAWGLNAMLVLSGICAVLAIFVLFIKTMSAHRKIRIVE
ncbi:MAG: hypothetical protein IKS60_02500 [Lachnospiraceae bacterium]|nr:hypothetical protein [Lachnospiraceae bacterium]MBR4412461.1 hypothetical protein [Lachnospiraceae bacterium]MBR5066223.1 hypothetical protein [Lachnospiraceae bacterium]